VLVFIDAGLRYRSIRVGSLSIVAGFVQLLGYGLGFLRAFGKRMLLRKGEFYAYEKNFYD
jgi:hypothetical protein